MKITPISVELNHEDLVNFLSKALCGCGFFSVNWNDDFWKDLPEGKKTLNPCLEDKLADILENKEPIAITDEEEGKTHLLKYEDILKAFNNPKYISHTVALLEETGDYYDANNLLQVAIFGEVVYG